MRAHTFVHLVVAMIAAQMVPLMSTYEEIMPLVLISITGFLSAVFPSIAVWLGFIQHVAIWAAVLLHLEKGVVDIRLMSFGTINIFTILTADAG
jgi:hypothetical protein